MKFKVINKKTGREWTTKDVSDYTQRFLKDMECDIPPKLIMYQDGRVEIFVECYECWAEGLDPKIWEVVYENSD